MGLFRRAQDDEARQALDRAVAALRECQRSGQYEVPVADVLEMLGAAPESGPRLTPSLPHPLADPVTGCLPVTPARP